MLKKGFGAIILFYLLITLTTTVNAYELKIDGHREFKCYTTGEEHTNTSKLITYYTARRILRQLELKKGFMFLDKTTVTISTHKVYRGDRCIGGFYYYDYKKDHHYVFLTEKISHKTKINVYDTLLHELGHAKEKDNKIDLQEYVENVYGENEYVKDTEETAWEVRNQEEFAEDFMNYCMTTYFKHIKYSISKQTWRSYNKDSFEIYIEGVLNDV